MIVVNDCFKTIPMAVEEVFIMNWVIISNSSGRVAQEGVRKLVKGSYLSFVSQPTHVYDNSLAEVMVVRYWMEVMLAGVLRVLVYALLLMSRDFWQRSLVLFKQILNAWNVFISFFFFFF